MSGPRNTEPQANGALARALSRRNPDWNDRTVHAERTHVIHQAGPGTDTGKRPDILVAPPRRQPVIVETEFAPARTVEQDATARLGTSLHSTGEDIEGVLSVVLPESLKTGDLETVDKAAFRLALVIPFAFVRGKSWKGAREALRAHYSDVHVVSIAAIGSTARAFSADTGMAECLVVATKRSGGKSRAAYSNLAARPSSLLEAAVEAKNAKGRAVQGNILDAGAAGVRSMSVLQAVRNLEAGNLRLPRTPVAVRLPMVTLGTVAEAVSRTAMGRARPEALSSCVRSAPARCRRTRCSGRIRPTGKGDSWCCQTPAGIPGRTTNRERSSGGISRRPACTPIWTSD